MIHVIEDNYNKTRYYKHKCDKCESILTFSEENAKRILADDMLVKAIQCPLCGSESYINDFIEIDENTFNELTETKEGE